MHAPKKVAAKQTQGVGKRYFIFKQIYLFFILPYLLVFSVWQKAARSNGVNWKARSIQWDQWEMSVSVEAINDLFLVSCMLISFVIFISKCLYLHISCFNTSLKISQFIHMSCLNFLLFDI